MAEIINLRGKRKEAARKAARAAGDEQAARFGRTRGQKMAEAADQARVKAQLDGKKLDDPGAP